MGSEIDFDMSSPPEEFKEEHWKAGIGAIFEEAERNYLKTRQEEMESEIAAWKALR